VIHVVGTSRLGDSLAVGVLSRAGLRTGSYTEAHIIHMNERISEPGEEHQLLCLGPYLVRGYNSYSSAKLPQMFLFFTGAAGYGTPANVRSTTV
jgi:non-ribosomal peptide synthetase component E (peptide arylation enzyme)